MGTRGGPARVRLLRVIVDKPLNAHQLADEVGMDYTTIRHHLDVLVKHNVIESVGDKYGAVFYLTKWLAREDKLIKEILDESWKK